MSEEMSRKIQKLVDFIDQSSFTISETMTFREFHALVDAKEEELGIDWAKLQDQYDEDSLTHWSILVGEAMEGKEIDEHLMDLPIGFRDMPEYEPMRIAEREFWENNPNGTDEQLLQVIEAHLPKRDD